MPYMAELREFLKQEASKFTIYPPMKDIFNAFWHTPFDHVKAVILGQDPYHGRGQAHGLCFSVKHGVAPPPSLINIYKELNADLGIAISQHGDLQSWAQRGVMLLNTSLTVRAGQAGSHRGRGWEIFTDKVIEILSKEKENLVFFLWGSPAQKKQAMLDEQKHLILKAPHPSPFSAERGFFGCRHFSKCNAYLEKNQIEKIDWSLD